MANKPYRVAKKTYSYVELQHMTEAELKSVKKLLRDNVTRNLRKLQKGGFNETPATLGLAKAINSEAILSYNGEKYTFTAPQVSTFKGVDNTWQMLLSARLFF